MDAEPAPERRVLFPLLRIVERHRAQHPTVAHLILTHPHTDHVYGFVEALEALSPRHIGVTGPDPRRNLALEAQLDPPTAATSVLQKRKKVKTALARIQVWDEDNPGRLLSLCDRDLLPVSGPVALRVCAPDRGILARWWQEGVLPHRISEQANALSVVIELSWNGHRIVLGGDLPGTDKGPVETGWNRVLESYPEIGGPLGLKVPHHGSLQALHVDLLGVPEDRAAWIVTPYASSDLPRADDDDGLDILCQRQSPVLLTAPSMARRLQAALGEHRVKSRVGLEELRDALRSEGLFDEGDELVTAGTAAGPFDPVWYFAVDENGAVVDRRWGSAALEVHRHATGAAGVAPVTPLEEDTAGRAGS